MDTYFWSPLINRDVHSVSMQFQYCKSTGTFFVRNFGDSLGKILLCAELGNLRIRWNFPSRASIVSTGSIAETVLQSKSRKLVNLWGTGFKYANFNCALIKREFKILALRGKLSSENLKLGQQSVVLGDPALLTSLHYSASLDSSRSGKLFIPHFSTSQTKMGREMLAQLEKNKFVICHAGDDIDKIIYSIGRAKVVYSNALHPLIVADSLGVPAVRVIGAKSELSEFKYADYLSVFPESISWPVVSPGFMPHNTQSHQVLISQSMKRLGLIDERIREIQVNLREVLHKWSNSLP